MVTLVNGQKQVAEKLHFDSDSTSWVDPDTRKVFVVPTTEVSDVRFTRRDKGAIQGLGFGLAGGVLTGVVLGLSSGGGFFTAEESAIIASTFFGVLGALIGTLVGAIVGSKKVYNIEHEYPRSAIKK